MRILGFIELATLIPTNRFISSNFPPKNSPNISFKHFKVPAFSLYCAGGFMCYLGLFIVSQTPGRFLPSFTDASA